MSSSDCAKLLCSFRKVQIGKALDSSDVQSRNSPSIAVTTCLLNSDLCRTIASYCCCFDLLQLEQVNLHWQVIVLNRFESMLELPGYKYLIYNRRKFISAKRLCCRVDNRQKNKNEKMHLLGGSYQSVSKVTCTLDISADISVIESLPPSLPPDLSCRASLIDSDGNLLVLGGYSDQFSTAINTVRCINMRESNSNWRTLSPLCQARCYGAAVTNSAGDLLHIGGGESPYQGGKCFADCYVQLYGEQDWQEVVVPDMQYVRCGHSAVVLFDDSIVVTGGYAGGTSFHNSVEMLTNTLDRWIQLPSMSVARSGMATVVGPCGSVYVAGGSPNGTVGHKTLERLDLREGTWTQLADMHVGRGYTTSCLSACENGFYVLGGIDSWVYSDNMEFYDFRMNQWTVKVAHSGNSSLLGRATAHLVPDI